MYTDYESLEAVIVKDPPQFAYSQNGDLIRYYYQWTPETQNDFEKVKNSLYTATATACDINPTLYQLYQVLSEVQGVGAPYDAKTKYWYYIGDQTINAAIDKFDNMV